MTDERRTTTHALGMLYACFVFVSCFLYRNCSARGVEFYPLDPAIDIDAQRGHPFDVILQKVPGSDGVKADWDERLRQYATAQPLARIVGLPELVKRVTNRGTMLDVVHSLGVANVSAPRQIVLTPRDDAESISQIIADAGLKPPYLAKALICDGSEHSHSVAIIHDQGGIEALRQGRVCGIELPCVLQEYVNHGGCLFKVYVVGESVTSATRRSLPDLVVHSSSSSSNHDYGDEGAVVVPRVSRFTQSASDDDDDEDGGGDGDGGHEQQQHVPPPDDAVLRDIGLRLHAKLGLDLFNFDLIRDRENPSALFIVDINYLPGISKMPGYFDHFTNFLASAGGGGGGGRRRE